MVKKLLLLLVFVAGCNSNKVSTPFDEITPINLPYVPPSSPKPGWEERGPEFSKWIAAGVRIDNGSGTMVHYDEKDNYVYVLSCGHMFSLGRGTADHYRKNPKSVNIEVFYHNQEKLEEPKSYKGEVLCHVWLNDIYDVSLLRFHPDWSSPWVMPVAPIYFKVKPGAWYHNIGCDGLSEVSHYLVKFQETNIRNDVEELICVTNAARGGRSGGGLLDEGRQLIGITSRSDRVGTTYYSSFKQIHWFLADEGYDFVLENRTDWARKIPILDRNNPQGLYSNDYIPMPDTGNY